MCKDKWFGHNHCMMFFIDVFLRYSTCHKKRSLLPARQGKQQSALPYADSAGVLAVCLLLQAKSQKVIPRVLVIMLKWAPRWAVLIRRRRLSGRRLLMIHIHFAMTETMSNRIIDIHLKIWILNSTIVCKNINLLLNKFKKNISDLFHIFSFL